MNAGFVVSNADLLQTIERLIGVEHVDPDYYRSVRKLRPSYPCFLTYIGVRDIATALLREAQGYYWHSWDAEEVARSAFKIFVPTLYEPRMAPPGGHIVIVQKLTAVDHGAIDDWQSHKSAVEQAIVADLERVMPGFSAHVVTKLSASALTSYRYTLNYQGAMLGWEMSPDQLAEGRPATEGPLKNLYFVGHWTQPGGGITPVMISAMQVAEAIGATTSGKSDTWSLWPYLYLDPWTRLEQTTVQKPVTTAPAD